jgi:flagellar L-ring protein FlgH
METGAMCKKFLEIQADLFSRWARGTNRMLQIRAVRHLAVAAMAVGLSGCVTTPTSIVNKPTSAMPAPAASVPPPATGSIFNAAAYKPLFEDRRAKRVGDMLFIVINENTNAGKKASSNASKKASAEASIPTLTKVLLHPLQGVAVSATSDIQFEDESNINSGNSFSGRLAVSVTNVLPNGYLAVAGEKQVALDKGIEYVRFSGVVNPDAILTGNTVSSTQVADARIEYRTTANIDAAEVTQWLARFFLSVLPL